jgi:hypothetical protein
MKMHMKLIVPLVVILLMGMGTSAFASLVCSATVPTLIPRGAINGHHQNLSDLLVSCTPGDAVATTTGTMTVAYNITLSNSTALPAGHVVSITNLTGSFVGLPPTVTTSNTGGPVTITIPAQAVPAAGTFTLANVLGSLAGAGGGSVSANISVTSASGNTSTTGGAQVVLTAALATIDGPTGTNPPGLTTGTNAAQFLPSGDPVPPNPGCSTAACADARATFHVQVSEAYNDAWRTPGNYFDNGAGTALNGTDVTFTFAGMLPNSVIQNCSAQISPAGPTLGLTGSGIANASGNASLTVQILAGAPTNNGAIETITLDCGTSMAAPAYIKGLSSGTASASITVSASQSPIGTNLTGMIPSVSTTGGVPRYQTGTSVGPVTVINFSGAVTGQTTMFIPFATASGAASPPAGTFNTGIAIANTSGDPSVFGAGRATDSAGNVTFYLFPADGSASTTITPATGCGLVGGVIAAGGSFICNLSTIMQAATPPMTGSFTGLVYIVANFSHAHGSAFVYGGGAADRLVSGTPIFTISNPLTVGRDTFGAVPTVEVTGQ